MLFNIIDNSVNRYDHLVPLHYMYLSYLSEMLPLPAYPKQPLADLKLHASAPGKLANGLATEQLSSRLVKADFTGAVIRGMSLEGLYCPKLMLYAVKRSKNASLIGLEGIVVVETAETFKIVTVENVVKSKSALRASDLQLIARRLSRTKVPCPLHHHFPSLRLPYLAKCPIRLSTRHSGIPRLVSSGAQGPGRHSRLCVPVPRGG